jgi:hypothetical protein
LGQVPRLESWNASDDPDQIALREYLDGLYGDLSRHLPAPGTPVSLGLAVGLGSADRMLDHRDLDNYLLPVTRRLRQNGNEVVSVHGSKSASSTSAIAVAAAVAADGPGFGTLWTVDVNVSYEKPEYKRAVRDAVAGAGELPAGPVALELCFSVGASRNWDALWKPTIDALGPLLGHAPGAAEWNARDGRITQLAMHCEIDADRRWDVSIAISAHSLIVPPDVSDELAAIEFALSYDGYADGDLAFLGAVARSVERDWQSDHVLTNDNNDLRRALFFLQRQHRANEDQRLFGTLPLVAAIIEELRRRSPSGFPNEPADL